MHEDQRRSGLISAHRHKQLAVNLQAIFTFEDDLLRHNQLF